ncbi:MAG: hypothetical protein JW934_06775, partial [Anaerolineae bacterium]|nr:hypothetical protein [Anaerolineae bacterium]
LALAGLLCGLSANTYLAIRAFPLVLGFFALWTISTWGSPRLRLRQWALFSLCALLAFAPLGWFFIQNPEFFSVRMSQASIFDPEIHQGDLPGALLQATWNMLGDFTVRGDGDPIYNLPGKPIFGPLIGIAFYGGLLVCIYQIFLALKRPYSLTPYSLTPYPLLLLWLPVMMIPNILGARGIPHHLRGMGMSPVVFYVAALGIALSLQIAQRWLKRLSPAWTIPLLCLTILLAGGITTWHQYAGVWANSAGAYYRGSASLRRAAEYLGGQNAQDTALWVSNGSYRHTTFAALCANYAHLKWFSGQTLVLGADERPALYSFDFTNPLDPVLARYIPQDALVHRDMGPDGGIGFEAYLLTADRRPPISPQRPTEINLGNTLMLIGYDLNAPAVSGQTLDVTLYWRILRDTTQEDWTFFVELVDELGFGWGGETFFNYPSAQWRAGETVLFRKEIAIAPGAPPGQYALTVGVFAPSLDARLPLLNPAGQMAGTAAQIGPIQIAPASAPPAELPPIQHRMEQTFAFGNGAPLTLLGYDLERTSLRPGERIILSLYWQAVADLKENRQVMIGLYREGERISLWNDAPVHGQYPFSQWQPGEFVRDRYALRLPADLPAGSYQLRLGLMCGEESVLLGEIQVQATDRLWELPPFDHPVGARLGPVELVGYTLDRSAARPGESLRLTLIWRCLEEMDVSYTVFTHLLDQNEGMRGQKDNPPVSGAYPTTLWLPGEIVVDEYEIAVKPDAAPGTHVIEVGMYDPGNLQRLPIADPSGAVGDRVLLGQVVVEGGP